jgi:oligopeptide transport system ATP-binding protein
MTVSQAAAAVPDRHSLLEVRALTKHYPVVKGTLLQRTVGAVRAVDGIDFAIERGETLALVGESGCGKSTTGRAILRLTEPTSGSVRLDGVELTTLDSRRMNAMRRRMQMIFQDPFASLNPRMTVGAILEEPLEVHNLKKGSQKRERVSDLLRHVGLDPHFASRYPHEFSGGQRQRIGIARALAVQPEFIVADEPISALDVSIQAQIVNLLEDLQQEFGLTYLLIAHDLAVVRHIAHRVGVMYLGKIVELADRSELYVRPLHPYTESLLSAVPVPDPAVERNRKRIILMGDVPSPVNPPPGCRFHTRCPLRERLGRPEVCATTEPPLIEHLPRRWAACHFAGQVTLLVTATNGTVGPLAGNRERPTASLPRDGDGSSS